MDSDRHLAFGADISAQLQEITTIYGRIDEREQVHGPAGLESLAFQLHNLYNTIERLFELIARTFENHIETQSRYHIELLKRMRVEVPGVRPAAVSDEAFPLLDNLRGFRHRIRYASTIQVDERLLRIVLEDARALRSLLWRDVEGFLAKLDPRES